MNFFVGSRKAIKSKQILFLRDFLAQLGFDEGEKFE